MLKSFEIEANSIQKPLPLRLASVGKLSYREHSKSSCDGGHHNHSGHRRHLCHSGCAPRTLWLDSLRCASRPVAFYSQDRRNYQLVSFKNFRAMIPQ